MILNEDMDSNASKGPRNWRQFASLVLAAMLGSGVTATVLAIAWQPGSRGPLTQASASTTTQAASVRGSQGVVATNNLDLSTTITRVFNSVEPAVVAVVNYANVSDFFTQQTKLQEYGVGSGVLFHKDANYAYIVTNNHVVSGAAKLEVVLYTGKHITATVVGADPYTDLAVIRIPIRQVKQLRVAQFENSSAIHVGQLAIAIGTPMGLDFAESVTSGIISGKQRMMPVEEPETQQTLDYQSVIQTDAAINPGNSGGPLLDANGNVVGINSSKIAAQSFEGMGFAIPSNEVRSVIQQIMTTGHVVHPSLGISAYSLSSVPQQYWPNVPVDYGVYVASVDTAAARAGGLKTGDVIVSVNGQSIQDEADLRTDLFAIRAGNTVSLGVYRGNRHLTLTVKVGSMKTSALLPTQAQSASQGLQGGSAFDFSGPSPFGPSDPNQNGFGSGVPGF